MPVDTPLSFRATPTQPVAPRPTELPGAQGEPSYYDVSLLKPPVWGWEIASYFFLGGVSAGAYILARMAERFGGERYRDVTRAGTTVAVLAALPCAPLLIADLGDPKRFHHMLRVFKPHSPMNLGAWTLTAYSGAAFLALLREWRRGDRRDEELSRVERVVDGLVLAVTDAAGVPLALLLAGYTGVLLSATSTPVWTENPWLGALFSASAMNTGAAAVQLALAAGTGPPESTAAEALDKIDTMGHVAEGLTTAGYLAAAGSLAKPLTTGGMAPAFWGGVLGMAAGEVLKRLPLRGRAGRLAKVASSVVGLASGFALRAAFVYAGRLSGNDPAAARQASRPRP